jgi:fatty-acyl-CoA synthase
VSTNTPATQQHQQKERTRMETVCGQRPHFKHWPARLPHRITPAATSLWHNLAVSALRYPNKPALRFFDTQLSYQQVQQQAESVAAWLQAHGVGAGDRVLLMMQNCPQWVVAHFAILRLGAVVVPVNPMNKAAELEHFITDPQARVAIVAADLAQELVTANAVLPVADRLQHLLVTHYTDAWLQAQGALPTEWDGSVLASHGVPAAWHAWFAQRHGPWSAFSASDTAPVLHTGQWHQACGHPTTELGVAPNDPTQLAVLPYTSGTTGLPKGCMHTHASLMHNATAAGLWGNSCAENVGLLVVPMFHITGMVSGMHASVYVGGTLVIMPRWDRDLAGELISRHRVTHWTNIPTMIMDLLASPRFAEYDLTSLVYIGGGGAAMPQAVAQRLLEQYGLRYVEGYGLTETAAPSHVNPPERPKQQCLGIPFLSTDARVVDPETLKEVPPGTQGEIVIHGPEVFQGYWRRPEATAAAFFELEGKRFFRTGDLGSMDDEGYFFLTDRLKRMINASGFKVWPAEVESLMFRHPAIAEACVIATRDSYRGESVKAVVVLRAEHRNHVTEQDILNWCRDHMAVYKAPKVVQFAEALPKSGSGKVMWRTLQETESHTEPPQSPHR